MSEPKPPETIWIDPNEWSYRTCYIAFREKASPKDIAYVPKSTHDAEVERIKAEVNFFRSAFERELRMKEERKP